MAKRNNTTTGAKQPKKFMVFVVEGKNDINALMTPLVSFFDLFYNKSLSEIEDFFRYINQKVEIKTKILGEEKPAQVDKLRIKVIFPYSEILTMKNTTNLLIANNDIWKLKQISIEESTMVKLLNSHIDNWVSIICQEEILEDTKEKNLFDD